MTTAVPKHLEPAGTGCPIRAGESVSVVLLVHNEAEVIEEVVRDFHLKITSKIPGSEIVVAEDGSTDGTPEILARLSAEMPELRVESRTEKRGYSRAFTEAMSLPRNEWIVFCDASGKHDPDDVWTMYHDFDDYDLIVGYKIKRQDPAYRILLTTVFNRLVNAYFGVQFRDIDCPLRMMRKSVFQKAASRPWIQRALINFEVTIRMAYLGCRIKQVPVQHFARKHGASRGLPPRTIPKVIWKTLRNFPQIKRTAREIAADHQNAAAAGANP